jgi:hypothetical protein
VKNPVFDKSDDRFGDKKQVCGNDTDFESAVGTLSGRK